MQGRAKSPLLKRPLFPFILLVAATAATAIAQPPTEEAPAGAVRERVEALRALQASFDSRQQDLEAAAALAAGGEAGEEAVALVSEVEALGDQFEALATGAETALWKDPGGAEFDLRAELEAVFRPMIEELQRTTTSSREIERLRTQVDLNRQRIEAGRAALIRLGETIDALDPGDETLLPRLEGLRKLYSSRVEAAEAQSLALTEQLEERQVRRPSLTRTAGDALSGFIRYRGLNLVLALLAFFAVFLLVRLAGRAYERMRDGARHRSLGERLVALVLHIASVVLGLLAALVVLNARADWFLLGLFLILLASLAWGGVKALPAFVEEIRLILNLGAVREGEVLTFEGLAWKVESIGVRAELSNPQLDGGRLHLPVGELIGLHSRAAGAGEAMFPTEEGDWVELDDGVIGQVTLQTPRTVKVELLGGAQKAYGTTGFLERNPKNLSRGFRVEHVFGLDYGLQAISTTEIPRCMEEALEREMRELLGTEPVRRVEVEFREANSSSLDYEIQVDLTGAAAHRYEDVERAIPRILVDLCNEKGWAIPFPQLTVHAPEGRAASPPAPA